MLKLISGILKELDKEKEYLLYCAIGLRGYIGYHLLVQNRFKRNNSCGGYDLYRYANKKTPETPVHDITETIKHEKIM